MRHVRVNVTRRVDDHFLGWVEFTILGAGGKVFRFVDKDPAVSTAEILSFPFEATIACNVLGTAALPDGSNVIEIDTSPCGIESDAGETIFWVHESQMAPPQSAA